MMKYLILAILLQGCANGRLYIDTGLGYIDEVTATQTTTISSPIGETSIDSEVSVPLDSFFILLRGGYRVGSWHLFEYERIGDAERYFDTIKIYKRFEF